MIPRPARLLVTGARPWSDGAPVAGADAIAITDGRISGLGRAAELEALAGPATERLDARGATVTPGCTDAHLHLLEWARSSDAVALAGARTRGEALERVRAFAADHASADPVVGRGWDANAWDEPPERAALDAVTGDRPALLHSHDFHALWVNSAALREAGITRATRDPEGGRFERDGTGEPTGVVREHAVRAFGALEARARSGDDAALVARAARALHALGFTAIHDFEGPEAHRALRALTRRGGPRLRVLAHLPHAALDHALGIGLASGTGDDDFRIGAVKLFADGTLGSRTAAMLAPYEGGGGTGMDLMPPDELARTVRRAVEGGLSVAIHAIGDRAARSALDAFEAVRDRLEALALPPRIEHVQLLDPADRPRLARLGVAASVQPSHCLSDLELARRHWGARCEYSYPWRSLLEAGVTLAFGSDAPVEPPGAAFGLFAAVARRRPDGTPAEGFVPGERLTLDQALTAWTEGPARLAGAWPRLGRIAPGALADLVVWDHDLHRLPADRLAEVAPAATVIGGEVVYRRPGGTSRAIAGPVGAGTIADGGR